jgi:hypothetical protein
LLRFSQENNPIYAIFGSLQKRGITKMFKYAIRKELIIRVSAITSKYRETRPHSDGLTGEIKRLKHRAATTQSFTDEIILTLNKILQEQKIEMTEDDEKALTEYLKPTIVELIQQHFT